MPFGDRSPALIVMATGVDSDSDSKDGVSVYFDRYTGAILEIAPEVEPGRQPGYTP